MKIQTQAPISSLSIDGESVELDSEREIELEFSAIDTGGAFRDPILDFSFCIPSPQKGQLKVEEDCEFAIGLLDPHADKTITFDYEGRLHETNNAELEVNGRLKDEQLSRDLIGFVLQLMR